MLGSACNLLAFLCIYFRGGKKGETERERKIGRYRLGHQDAKEMEPKAPVMYSSSIGNFLQNLREY